MNNFYKFILAIAIASLALVAGKKALVHQDSAKSPVYFFNWGDYVDPDLIKEFEEETGYEVIYESFDSNEAMIAKVLGGATPYDLVVPSEYTVEIMRDKGLLKPLDKNRLEGLGNIDPKFLDRSFDPDNKYSIPYLWGSLGIVYNSKYYKEEDFSSWKNLWDPKFEDQILLYDGAREVMGLGLLAKGYSLNTKDPKILKEVQEDIFPLMDRAQAILADEIKMYLALEESNVGFTFSGEAVVAMEDNEDLAYTIPKEGSNIWFDNLVIPSTCQNEEGAYALINFFLRPDVAARNADYIGYSTPNQGALDLLDEEVKNDPTLYPSDEIIEKLEVFEDLGQETTILYNDLFLETKIGK